MGMRVCMVGVGAFAQSFIPLFKAHPLVDDISLCDLDRQKLKENSHRHGVRTTYASLDEACAADVDAVAIITQNWMHAEQAVQALNAGKHVYSAVPTGITVDEVVRLVGTVETTGKVYMLGETSYYYPAVIYCREQFKKGAFGRVVYGEGEYYHDWDHGLYDVMKWRGGDRWREFAGGPPMHYPTHSTSQIISITGAHMVCVSCQGFVDTHPDGIYDPAANRWANPFSNESALFAMSDGSICRINEFRRIGHPGTVRMTVFGTEGSYEENWAGKAWVTKNTADCVRLDDLLACSGVPAAPDRQGKGLVTSQDGTHLHASRVHDVARLPGEFIGLPNGHCGSHQFLVDDFVRACVDGTLPPNNVWQAARYALPGIVAHESAMQGGALLEVPDCGDPPAAK
ncbi:MAG: 4-carboxy-2-hydroxymuconate-6-semialdehyde dehydrogenase [Candidatus Latescibacteria bacterium ADurb.Bin168]|nr:MAG: 4-carboxy-2-hydroxymuconate-6-semialdehyde dehydrogenase [Candidatus Latescibacteria bacterium ADurb.Bin168]